MWRMSRKGSTAIALASPIIPNVVIVSIMESNLEEVRGIFSFFTSET
jgi:hypothetical protein